MKEEKKEEAVEEEEVEKEAEYRGGRQWRMAVVTSNANGMVTSNDNDDVNSNRGIVHVLVHTLTGMYCPYNAKRRRRNAYLKPSGLDALGDHEDDHALEHAIGVRGRRPLPLLGAPPGRHLLFPLLQPHRHNVDAVF
ncbi:hypothetical protein BHM03_00037771 [Ensete ventricosum]|nr:hypothetical protein BHM03_00037771 [Ensete ventricosum]